MSIVNAALRPSGASYRNKLLSGEINKNPSSIIDELLADNNGYLIFQEDTIKFLQQICGLTGSEADNIRRAIGRKQIDRLEKALPKILNGYCNMSQQPRKIAEDEAKQFLQIIEDSARYQFGFNHSTGYSMIGYLCAYLRYYYPEEFIAAYLNCANNADDIIFGTELAKLKDISILPIKYGKSLAEYSVDKLNHSVYKGIESIKYCNSQIADELYKLAKNNTCTDFISLLTNINDKTSVNSKQLKILIGLNFFSDYGKNKRLFEIERIYENFYGIKQVKKDKMEELGLNEFLMKKYAGKETAKLYKEIDSVGLINELTLKIPNESIDLVQQMKFEKEYLEYVDYICPEIEPEYYIVIDYIQGKDLSKPRFTVRRICDGVEIKTRIKYSKMYKEQPFGLWDILYIKSFEQEFKKKPNANGEWVVTDETEDIPTSYNVIKRYKQE